MIVAKINNDEDVKQWLVVIVFHASVTQQRSSGSKTRISCSHVHERTKVPDNTHPCKQGFEKKEATQTNAENLVDADARREKLENTMSSASSLQDVTQNKIRLRSLSTRLRGARQVVRMLLQNSGLEPVSRNSHKIIHNSGVCPRTYPQDQMRIKGSQSVAPVFQKRSTAHH